MPGNNDRLGKYWEVYERDGQGFEIETFYAAGSGPRSSEERRADGNGGLLARGYWARSSDDRGHLSGPYRTRNMAIEGGVRWSVAVRARKEASLDNATLVAELVEALEAAKGYMVPGPRLEAVRAALAKAKEIVR